MCGIAGFFCDSINREVQIKKMLKRMEHRGPDAEGVWIDSNSAWVLGHKRLSIVDLSAKGAQPMVSNSGRFIISYNGEIFNALQIKDKLKRNGFCYTFRGTSDTEILLEAIEFWGLDKTISQCKGMFAFALYDRFDKTLYLARDRVGEKPLYYGMIKSANHAPFFAFASDIALFKEFSGFSNSVDLAALEEFMMYGYIHAPMSIYENIYKLMPGTIMSIKPPYDTPQVNEYWSIKEIVTKRNYSLFTGTEEEASTELERLLKEAISSQMMADVPVGAFLSGGIDSATIVALMQSISNKPVKTFTIGFENKKYNESDYARDISKYLGTDHHEMIISEKDMQDIIPRLNYYFSEPFGDASMIPTYFVSKIAKEKVTVSLSGDAGDELFGGYEGYWKCNELWKILSYVPFPLRKLVSTCLRPFDIISYKDFHRMLECLEAKNIYQLKDAVFVRKNACFQRVILQKKINTNLVMQYSMQDDFSSMCIYDLLRYHPDDILVKVDRAGMAVSLENRIPMLDRDVLEFALSLPGKYKYSEGISKRVLRNVLYRHVPREMMDRPKQGFCVPIGKWLQEGESNIWAKELINDSRLINDNIINNNIIQYCWKNITKSDSMANLIWRFLMAEQWYRTK